MWAMELKKGLSDEKVGKQARRHRAHYGSVPPKITACDPPNSNCAPPSEDYVPKKVTG